MSIEVDKKFVYDNTEVVMTGRTASRNPRIASVSKTTPNRRAARDDVLVEITPVDPESLSWKKFVRERDLYTLHEAE